MSKLYLYGARICIPNYEHCPIKVGITSDSQRRYQNFASSLPFPLEWYGAWPAKNGRASEKAIFEMFKTQRLCGEWFAPSAELRNYIAQQVTAYQELIVACSKKRRRTRFSPKDVNAWVQLAEPDAYHAVMGTFDYLITEAA